MARGKSLAVFRPHQGGEEKREGRGKRGSRKEGVVITALAAFPSSFQFR